nr:MAG TPA: Elongation factor P hydroxylase [Caudoviricetes sp.]
MKDYAYWYSPSSVGRDTPEPIRSWRLCKTSQVQATVVETRTP